MSSSGFLLSDLEDVRNLSLGAICHKAVLDSKI
jgi:hypothetical protein